MKLISWLGEFHPAVVNFPIALLIAAALAEVLWVVTRHAPFGFASRYCIWLGASGALVSGILGWFLGGSALTDSDWRLTTHRWLGTLTATWSALVLVLSEVSHRQNSPRGRNTLRGVLLVAALLVMVTAFFGGAMAFGLHHDDWPSARESEPDSECRNPSDTEYVDGVEIVRHEPMLVVKHQQTAPGERPV
jgi:uncharacterized membrane protein